MEKKLQRKEGKFLGVCEGLGDYFGIDPTVMRILFVISVLFFGSGVLLYIVLALIMPKV